MGFRKASYGIVQSFIEINFSNYQSGQKLGGKKGRAIQNTKNKILNLHRKLLAAEKTLSPTSLLSTNKSHAIIKYNMMKPLSFIITRNPFHGKTSNTSETSKAAKLLKSSRKFVSFLIKLLPQVMLQVCLSSLQELGLHCFVMMCLWNSQLWFNNAWR